VKRNGKSRNIRETDSAFQEVISRWDSLPEAIRKAITQFDRVTCSRLLLKRHLIESVWEHVRLIKAQQYITPIPSLEANTDVRWFTDKHEPKHAHGP